MPCETVVQEYLNTNLRPANNVEEISDDSEIEALDACFKCGRSPGLYFMSTKFLLFSFRFQQIPGLCH